MKKALIAATLVALLVAVFAAAALGAEGRHCKNDPCYGNYRDNILLERKGNERSDTIYGRGGSDYISTWDYRRDKDAVYGGSGRDNLTVVDHDGRDYVSGGPGRRDNCDANVGDIVGPGCESVRRAN